MQQSQNAPDANNSGTIRQKSVLSEDDAPLWNYRAVTEQRLRASFGSLSQSKVIGDPNSGAVRFREKIELVGRCFQRLRYRTVVDPSPGHIIWGVLAEDARGDGLNGNCSLAFNDDSSAVIISITGMLGRGLQWTVKVTQRKRQQTAEELMRSQGPRDFSAEFILSAKEGRIDLMEELLRNGVDVEAKDKDGRTALITASEAGRLDVVQALISHQASVNAKDQSELCALVKAVKGGHVEVCRVLLEAGAEVDATNIYGDTCLITASIMGQESLVWDLLGSGAQVNAVDKDGCTPLMWAARKGFAEVFALLLAVGGDPTIVDKHGRRALDWARDPGDDLFRRSGTGHSAIINQLESLVNQTLEATVSPSIQ